MFVLNSDITIGSFSFSGVHQVDIRRSLHTIEHTATIIVPSVARYLVRGKPEPGAIITGKQFKEGDPVTIKLGYNNDLQTEFSGFVRRLSLKMPLEIECEGYSWLLRKNKISEFRKDISLKELLQLAIAGIDPAFGVSIVCNEEFGFSNVHLRDATGFDIINNISKFTDGAITCCFIEPGKLWCGRVYSSYASGSDVFGAGSTRYRMGFNALDNNRLKERRKDIDPVLVRYHKKTSGGQRISGESDVYNAATSVRSKILNQLNSAPVLKLMANEKAYQLSYSGYEGDITGFLQPYTLPGYDVYVTDARYPERDGVYLAESTHVTFGIQGARRTIELGPRRGFAKTNGK